MLVQAFKIRDWPVGDRPQEKLIRQGAATLSDAELLAVFLRTGTRGADVLRLAQEALIRLGGLRTLLRADRVTFTAIPGLGDARYAQLQAALELGRRALLEPLRRRGSALTNPELAQDYVRSRLRDRRREVFLCLYLDTRHAVLDCEELFEGTLDSACVYPREVLEACLRHSAAAVIFAHNHPSGVAEPSEADRRITEVLVKALELVDIRVLDHLVVGDGEVVSFAERGLL